MRGVETAVVLLLSFFVLPLLALLQIGGAHVPLLLWVGLVVAVVALIPAHRYSERSFR